MVLATLLPSEQDVVISANHLSEPGMHNYNAARQKRKAGTQQPVGTSEERSADKAADVVQHTGSQQHRGGEHASHDGTERHRGRHKEKLRDKHRHRDKHWHSHHNAPSAHADHPSRQNGHAAGSKVEVNGTVTAAPGGRGWLREQIRVRVVDKASRAYFCKGTVVDMAGPHTCSLQLDRQDGGRVVEVRPLLLLQLAFIRCMKAHAVVLVGCFAAASIASSSRRL